MLSCHIPSPSIPSTILILLGWVLIKNSTLQAIMCQENAWGFVVMIFMASSCTSKNCDITQNTTIPINSTCMVHSKYHSGKLLCGDYFWQIELCHILPVCIQLVSSSGGCEHRSLYTTSGPSYQHIMTQYCLMQPQWNGE